MGGRGDIKHAFKRLYRVPYMLMPDLTSLVPPEFTAITASSEDNWHSLLLFFLQLYSCSLIMVYFNPFAPGDFAEKRVLKLVEWFSGHCCAIKS